MAHQYAKFGVAAILAAPALAIPRPDSHQHLHRRQNVYTTVTTQVDVTVTQYGEETTPPQAGNGNWAQGYGNPNNQQKNNVPAPAAPAGNNAPVKAADVRPSGYQQPSGYQPPAQSTQPTVPTVPASSVVASSNNAPSPPANTYTPPSGPSTGGNKAGIGYDKSSDNFNLAMDIIGKANGKISWMYDWEGYPCKNGAGSDGYDYSGVEFVPMFHSADGDFLKNWQNPGFMGPQGKGAKHALYMNEPDYNGVSYSDAAKNYPLFAQGTASDTKLGGPALVNGQSGRTYLTNFLQSCSGCKIDFAPYHYYSGASDTPDSALSAMQADLVEFQKILPKGSDGKTIPVWVTEFSLKAEKDGGNFDANTRADFISKAAAWMDGQSFIERYSPYHVTSQGGADAMTSNSPITSKYLSS